MKDCTTCKYGFVDEQLGFPMCHHPKRFSEDCVDFNMHEEIEEPKKTTGIEEKNLPEGLEKAADRQAFIEPPYSWEIQPGTFGSTPLFLMSNIRSAFKAGAEWQKDKMLKDNPVIMPVEDFQALIDSHAKRVEADYKEKILKEAVEFECIGKKVKMTIQELINYYIDTECCNVAEECGF